MLKASSLSLSLWQRRSSEFLNTSGRWIWGYLFVFFFFCCLCCFLGGQQLTRLGERERRVWAGKEAWWPTASSAEEDACREPSRSMFQVLCPSPFVLFPQNAFPFKAKMLPSSLLECYRVGLHAWFCGLFSCTLLLCLPPLFMQRVACFVLLVSCFCSSSSEKMLLLLLFFWVALNLLHVISFYLVI